MPSNEIVITFSSIEELEVEFEDNLKHGGAFAKGASGFERGQDCALVLKHPVRGRLVFEAGVSLVVPSGEKKGVGVAIQDFSPEKRAELEAFIKEGGARAPEPEAEESKKVQTVHERLRGLSTSQQQKMAFSKTLAERVALERIYGKFVWDKLLKNSAITIPEVARIARMGNLPRPLLEFIVSNGAWINAPHIRRALLSNPRLTGEMINKVVRTMNRNELKLAGNQTGYSQAVKAAAKNLLKS